MGSRPLREQLREALGTIADLGAECEALRAECERLRGENAGLADRVSALEAAAKADSTTTSTPPSRDGVETRKKRAERRRDARAAKRSAGKQPGAPGKHLARRSPDDTVEHRPLSCKDCGTDLAGAEVVGTVTRQVIDLPPVTPVVVDHVAYRCRCACGAETLAPFPPQARAPVCWGPEVRAFAIYLLVRQHLPVERTAELLADLLGAPVSAGWLCQIQTEAAGRLAPFITELKDRLGAEPVVHADETGTQVGLVKHWMHTLATRLLTLIAVHPKRGLEAIRDIGILPGYTGVIVHDGYAPYDTFERAEHAQCGAHLLRHLDDVGQAVAFELWTSQLAGVLIDAKRASETAASAGQPAVADDIATAIRDRYAATLDVAFALLPPGPPPRRRHTGPWSNAQRKAWNLASRMRTGTDDVLRCLADTRVPLDNNLAERALRMVKIHDKISGCFHSLDSAEAFAAIRSYIQTANNHGENLLEVLRQLFNTRPWIPPASISP